MHKLISICLVFMISLSLATAQDFIHLNDSTIIMANVTEINDVYVVYKKFENINGPSYKIKVKNISHIIYQNGSSDNFSLNNVLDNNNSMLDVKFLSDFYFSFGASVPLGDFGKSLLSFDNVKYDWLFAFNYNNDNSFASYKYGFFLDFGKHFKINNSFSLNSGMSFFYNRPSHEIFSYYAALDDSYNARFSVVDFKLPSVANFPLYVGVTYNVLNLHNFFLNLNANIGCSGRFISNYFLHLHYDTNFDYYEDINFYPSANFCYNLSMDFFFYKSLFLNFSFYDLGSNYLKGYAKSKSIVPSATIDDPDSVIVWNLFSDGISRPMYDSKFLSFSIGFTF